LAALHRPVDVLFRVEAGRQLITDVIMVPGNLIVNPFLPEHHSTAAGASALAVEASEAGSTYSSLL